MTTAASPSSPASPQVELVEVSPRDGLQLEAVLPTHTKVELITKAAQAGLQRIEVASFAHPQHVPQMADAEAVIEAVRHLPNLRMTTLVLNERGLDRALAIGAPEINMVVLATEAFSQRNQGMSRAEAVADWLRLAKRAHSAGIRAGVTISAAFGCPFEGEVALNSVLELVKQVAEANPIEISLADTIGVGVPSQVSEMVGQVRELTNTAVRCHLHDTRNTGVANSVAALQAGAVALDTSIGGVGGCPFAPAATGNVATEDVAYTLGRMGYDSGVNLNQLLEIVPWFGQELGRSIGGGVARAGNFPSPLTHTATSPQTKPLMSSNPNESKP